MAEPLASLRVPGPATTGNAATGGAGVAANGIENWPPRSYYLKTGLAGSSTLPRNGLQSYYANKVRL